MRTDRGFQRIVEVGSGCTALFGCVVPVRLDDGTHRLVVCEGTRFWTFVAADHFVNQLIHESPVMPKVGNRGRAHSFYMEVVRKDGDSIDIELPLPYGSERRV
ncbi:hypothetical protein HYW68_01210 [Candidatus Parcubacteria bacterium]|nr:hypothetical protein [Candidatus Parcubacteria bacterium]